MVAPRVTKCGHLFCYGCILQYLEYESEKRWKKCPLCAESIYKKDLRKAQIVSEAVSPIEEEELKSDKEGQGEFAQYIEFSLMVRSKSNINTKMKAHDKENIGKVVECNLPTIT